MSPSSGRYRAAAARAASGPSASSTAKPSSSSTGTLQRHRLVVLGARAVTDHHEVRLLRHRAGDLAAQRGDRLGGAVAGEVLQRAGDHDGQPGQRLRPASRPAPRSIRTPAARHLLTISRCQSTVNHSSQRLGDRRADALHRGDLLGRGGLDRVDRAEVVGQRLGRARADVPDRQRDDDPPQWTLLGLVEVGQQRGRRWPTGCRSCSRRTATWPASSSSRREQVALVVDDAATRAAPPPPCSRAPRCPARPGRPGGTAAPAAGPGTSARSGSGCRRRPPWPAPAWCRRPDTAVGMTNVRSVPSRFSTHRADDLGDDVARPAAR